MAFFQTAIIPLAIILALAGFKGASPMALEWQTVTVPLAAGLDNKSDPRALEPPALLMATNVEFDELGGLQKRKPYSALPAVDTSGAAITNMRRLAVCDDELLLFTKDKLYSYAPSDAGWAERATYLAAAVGEDSVFTRTTEQTQCDRAELAGVIMYAWLDASTTSTVYVAARDATTGAVLLSPTAQSNSPSTTQRPRLIALNAKFLLLARDSSSRLVAKVFDPTDLATGAAASWTVVSSNLSLHYDVIQSVSDPESAIIAWRRPVTTSYDVASIDETLAFSVTNKARVCDGPIALAQALDGRLLVARGDGTSVRADLLTAALVDSAAVNVAIGTATGTPINQIAASFKTTASGGEYTAHAFWSADESTIASTDFLLETNTITTAGTAGTESTIARRLGIVTRAFTHENRVFLWAGFGQGSTSSATQLQNTYFLYRDDGHLVAKAAPAVGGGFSQATGHLANVQSLGGNAYACCLIERRTIPVGGGQKAYAARAPRDVVVTFDSDAARRSVQLGRTLYVTGGQVRQYDGAGLYEVGFPLFPYDLSFSDSGIGGNLAAGDYLWAATLSWDNARGERERSTTAVYAQATMAASRRADAVLSLVPVTTKTALPAYEIYRTTVNPLVDTPLYLVTSKDPSATGANRYIANDPSAAATTFTDNFSDATLLSKEQFPENGGVLESLAPPAGTVFAASQDRLFIAGVPGQPDEVYYSKLRGADSVAEFNDALRFSVPTTGGAITALAFLNEGLIVFKESAIYAVPGFGFDNIGGGTNYGPARQVSIDIGAESADAVATVPQGLLFKSRKGWYLLDPGFSPRYVGGAVADYDSEAILSIDVLESQHQVRCLTGSRLLVWDYLVNQWAEWTIAGGRDAVMWQGDHVYCTSTAVLVQDADFTNEVDYALDVQTAPIKVAGILGYQKTRKFHVLGEYRSPHGLRVRLYNDNSATASDDKTWTAPSSTAGAPLELRHGPAVSKSRAVSVRLTDVDPGATPWGESLKLTAIGFEIGVKAGLNKRLGAGNKQ